MTAQLARRVGSTGPVRRALPFRRRLGIVAVLAAAVVGATFAPKALHHSPAAPVVRNVASIRAAGAQGIEALQGRLRAVPQDWRAWAALGSAYVQQARITGDPTWYPRAERSLKRSLFLETKGNDVAMTGMGALAAARHDFAGALVWGNRAHAIDAYNASAYGVIGDALIELGRYPQAFDALQRMVDLRPGLPAYARASYAWELQGNLDNAEHALRLALQAAVAPADAAFASYYLGELEWNRGRVSAAEAWYRQSAAHDASFVPAMQGLAKIDAAHGRIASAIARYETVVQRLPLPQYLVELSDLYGEAGDAAGRQRVVDLLAVQERLFRANGVNVDLEQALFDADHGVHVAAGLRAALAEWTRRKSVFVADAVGWALYAGHRNAEALTFASRALRLGTRNATFFFHRGMIERALGKPAAARRDIETAMRINPHFSFRWAPQVSEILRGLR